MANLQGFRVIDKEGEYISLERLIDHLRSHPLGDGRVLPLIIWGAMGIGKTQQIRAYARSRGIGFSTYHPAHDVDGSGVVGEAIVDKEGNTSYAWPAWLPTEEWEHKEGVLFIDELNRAPKLVLAGLMEILGEQSISQSGWKLPSGWNIVAAANPRELDYQVNELDEAMVDRMLHYAPGWDKRHWGRWAQKAGLPPLVIDFALRQPEHTKGMDSGLVHVGEEQLPQEILDKLKCSPRTLEYIGALYEEGMSPGLLRVCAEGLMGREAAEGLQRIHDHASEQRVPDAETILSEPVAGSEGTPVYAYDEFVARWRDDPATGAEILRAACERLVIYFLGKELPPREQNESEEQHHIRVLQHDRDAQLAGRFLASVGDRTRSEAYKSLDRSIPEWLPVIRLSADRWLVQLAGRNQLPGGVTVAAQLPGEAAPGGLPAGRDHSFAG